MNKNHKTILLVEDNSDDEELARLAFAECKLGNKLMVARDGQEALDYLFAAGQYSGRNACELPQLILLDLKLPKVEGLEVLRHIRANEFTQFLPVVILTSSREESDLVGSYKLGANSYIQKPVDYPHFIDAVRQLGLYWLAWNEIPATCGI